MREDDTTLHPQLTKFKQDAKTKTVGSKQRQLLLILSLSGFPGTTGDRESYSITS